MENRATALGSLSETWGGNGLRASEGGTTYYLYDGSVPVCELSSSGAVAATNTFGASGLLSRRTSSGNVFYTFDPTGNVAQRYTGTGTLVSSDLYDSFGSATSTGTPTDPFGYEGKFGYYSEHATSLILCGHRFYDTGTGRFITRDPIGYAGGSNLYGYVGNNAVNAVDPSGCFAPLIVFGVGALIGGAVSVAAAYGVSRATGAQFGWRQGAAAFVGGAIAGGFGALAFPLAGTLALGALGAGGSTSGLALGLGALFSGGASAAGQEASNLIDPCNQSSPLLAGFVGAFTGGLGNKVPIKGYNTLNQLANFGPRSFSGAFGSTNALTAAGTGAAGGGIGSLANTALSDNNFMNNVGEGFQQLQDNVQNSLDNL